MNLPFAQSDDTGDSELRVETRTHLFVLAMLAAATTLVPVRIRNLSVSGALIEGSNMPAVGSVVTIRRGGLSADGVLVWRSRNQAGLAFGSRIFVPAWLPERTCSKQSAIDQFVFETKDGSEVSIEPSKPVGKRAESEEILIELNSLRNDLSSLGDSLINDIILVATHPEIQTLDIAIQRVDRLIALAKTASHGSEATIDELIK